MTYAFRPFGALEGGWVSWLFCSFALPTPCVRGWWGTAKVCLRGGSEEEAAAFTLLCGHIGHAPGYSPVVWSTRLSRGRCVESPFPIISAKSVGAGQAEHGSQCVRVELCRGRCKSSCARDCDQPLGAFVSNRGPVAIVVGFVETGVLAAFAHFLLFPLCPRFRRRLLFPFHLVSW